MWKHLRSVRGYRTLSGNYAVKVVYYNHAIWLRFADIFVPPFELSSYFEARGTPTLHAEYGQRIKKEVKVMSFERGNYLDYAGWTGVHFALPNGAVISPKGAQTVTMEFREVNKRCRKSGSLTGWKRTIAFPLTGRHLPMFAIMAMFVPPLMRFTSYTGNLAFEIVGEKGVYKSLLLKLAASVAGRPSALDGNTYWFSFHHFVNNLAAELTDHADLPIVADDMDFDFFGRPPNHQVNTFRPLAAAMNEGSVSNRGNLPASRFLLLTAGLKEIGRLVGREPVEQMTGGRVHTIRLDEDESLDIFSQLPDDVNSVQEFVDALIEAMAQNHGQALVVFLRKLVQTSDDDEAVLRKRIKRSMDEFRRKADVPQDDEIAVRTADAFGLIYAAGSLARKWGILPTAWKCGPAVIRVYRTAIATTASERPLIDRLTAIARRKGVPHIGSRREKLSEKAAAKHDVFVRHKPDRQQLAIRRKSIRSYIPDWSQIQNMPQVRNLMDAEGKKRYRRIKLSKSPQDTSMYLFDLPTTSNL